MRKEDQQNVFYFQWHFIESCNLRCTHCYQKEYRTEHLPAGELLHIAEILERSEIVVRCSDCYDLIL